MLVFRRVGVSYIYKIESICVCSARLFIVNDNRINKCVLPVIEQDALFLSPFTKKPHQIWILAGGVHFLEKQKRYRYTVSDLESMAMFSEHEQYKTP